MKHPALIAESLSHLIPSHAACGSAMMLLVAFTLFLPGCSRTSDLPTLTRQDSPTAAGQTATEPVAKGIPGSLPENALVERGRTVFASQCSECHQGSGTGVPGIRIKYEPLSDQRITTVVRHGLEIECCLLMSPTKPDQLSDADLQATIIYLRNVQPDTFAPK